MTYGFRPANWWRFERELLARGIPVPEIEKLEMRPDGRGAVVTVTLRSGRVETWVDDDEA